MSTLAKSVRQAVLERDGYACVICGKQAVLYSIHPRKPLQIRRNGPATWDNVDTNTDGPGTVGAVLTRGLADWIGVD